MATKRSIPPISSHKEAAEVAQRLHNYTKEGGQEYIGFAQDVARLRQWFETGASEMRSTWKYLATLLAGWGMGAGVYTGKSYFFPTETVKQTTPPPAPKGILEQMWETGRQAAGAIKKAATEDSVLTMANKIDSYYLSVRQTILDITNPLINISSKIMPEEPAMVAGIGLTTIAIGGPSFLLVRALSKAGLLKPAAIMFIPTFATYASAPKTYTLLTGVSAIAGVLVAHIAYSLKTHSFWLTRGDAYNTYRAAENKALGIPTSNGLEATRLG